MLLSAIPVLVLLHASLGASPVAQAPTFAPATPTAQAPAPLPLGQRLRAEGPEIQRLLTEGLNQEAWDRAQALIPQSLPTFDPANAWTSYTRHRELVQAFLLPASAAFEAGQWEKALELRQKASEVARVNREESLKALGTGIGAWKATVYQKRATLKDVEGRMAELKAKPSLEPGEKQELELATGIARDITLAEKNIQILQGALDTTQTELDFVAAQAREIQDLLATQAKQLTEEPFKGDKEMWVEGAISAPSYLAAYESRKDKLFVLHRLHLLSPDNKKVVLEIDRLLGKVPEQPTPKKPAKKAGKKGK